MPALDGQQWTWTSNGFARVEGFRTRRASTTWITQRPAEAGLAPSHQGDWGDLPKLARLPLPQFRNHRSPMPGCQDAGKSVCRDPGFRRGSMTCMLVVTVANLKGGVGKTTSAVCLAQAASEDGETAMVVDSDPQGSAMRWGQLALDRDEPLSVLVTAHAGADLPRYVESLSTSTVLIDTGPSRSNEDVKVLRSAIKAADLVVVPCQPSGVDLDTIGAALDVCEEHDRLAVVLLTRTKAPTLVRDVRSALADAGARVLEADVPDRASMVRAYGYRPPNDVLDPYRAAWAEIATLTHVEAAR